MDAVVIAGGRVEPDLAQRAGQTIKALFKFNGKPCVQGVLDALWEAGIERVALVGSELLLEGLDSDPPRLLYTPEGTSAVDNLRRGIERLQLTPESLFLRCCSDLPLLNPRSLCEFLNRCPSEADFCLPLVPVENYLERFEHSPYVPIRLKEGRFLMGSLSVMRTGVFLRLLPLAERINRARKSQWQMILTHARTLGFSMLYPGIPFLWRFLRGNLSVHEVTGLIQRKFNVRLAIDLNAAPELAFDLDTVQDYEYTVRWFQKAEPKAKEVRC